MAEAEAARTKFEHAGPILNVASMARSLRYYIDVLGFSAERVENFPWAREMKVVDPDGHVLRFGSDPKDDAAR